MKQLTFLSLSLFPPLFLFTCALLVTQPLFIHVCDFPSLFIGSSVFPALLLFPVASWFVLSFFFFFFFLLFGLFLDSPLPAFLLPIFLSPAFLLLAFWILDLGIVIKACFFFFLTRLPLCLSFGSFTPPAGLGNPSLDHLQETIKAMIWWFIHMPTIKAIFCFGEWDAGHPIKLCCNNVNSTTPTTVAKWCLVPISKHFWRDLRCVVSI